MIRQPVQDLRDLLGRIVPVPERPAIQRVPDLPVAGALLAGMAAAQLAGEDFLVGLDRVRADQAGQLLVPVPGLATSTATGIARRFTGQHWRGAEAGLAAVSLGRVPA